MAPLPDLLIGWFEAFYLIDVLFLDLSAWNPAIWLDAIGKAVGEFVAAAVTFVGLLVPRGVDPAIGDPSVIWGDPGVVPFPAIIHLGTKWLRQREKAFLRVQGVTLAVDMFEAQQTIVRIGGEIVSSRVAFDRDTRSDLKHSFIHGTLSFIIPGLEIPVHGHFVFVNLTTITEKDKVYFERTHAFIGKEHSQNEIDRAVEMARKYKKELKEYKQELEEEFGPCRVR